MSRFRWWRRHDEIPVVDLAKFNPFRFGLVLLVVLVIALYFAFTKHIPYTHGFRLKGEFASALNIQPKAPVRIAGVNVGKVESVKRVGKTGLVTMGISSTGLPIHEDATLKIRPRLFLEGNWFVELQPGSPSAKTVSSGYTIPSAQTSDPVQLDQVLDALNTDTRTNLQNFLDGYGEALTRKPTAAENAEQEPEVRGLDGAQGLNRSYQRGAAALRDNAIVQQSFSGTSEHDLSDLIASIERVAAALNVHEQQLGEFIDNFNIFWSEFADQGPSFSAAIAQLPGALVNADRGLASLDAAFPSIRTFSLDLIPGTKLNPSTISAALPWIEQVQASAAPSELGGVASGLRAATPSIASLTSAQSSFFKQNSLFSQCLTKVLYPAGNTKLQDGTSTSGVEDYKEFWYTLVGLNSSGQGFDGNGSSIRSLVGGGGEVLHSAPVGILGSATKGSALVTRATLTPLGTHPAYPATEPPYKPLVPCYTQSLPEFNGPLASGPADGSGG